MFTGFGGLFWSLIIVVVFMSFILSGYFVHQSRRDLERPLSYPLFKSGQSL